MAFFKFFVELDFLCNFAIELWVPWRWQETHNDILVKTKAFAIISRSAKKPRKLYWNNKHEMISDR